MDTFDASVAESLRPKTRTYYDRFEVERFLAALGCDDAEEFMLRVGGDIGAANGELIFIRADTLVGTDHDATLAVLMGALGQEDILGQCVPVRYWW